MFPCDSRFFQEWHLTLCHPAEGRQECLQTQASNSHDLHPPCVQCSETPTGPRWPNSWTMDEAFTTTRDCGQQWHYVVEWILDSWLIWGWLHFLIKWEGYSYKENTWISEGDVSAPGKIWEFYQIHPRAPQRVRSWAFQSILSECQCFEGAALYIL